MAAAAVFNVIKEPLAQEFEEIFEEHYPLVYRTAYSVTGNPHDAEDVVQTIFLRLYRRGFPSGFTQNPKGYLYRAAVNGGLSVVRLRRRHVLTAEVGLPDVVVEPDVSRTSSEIQQRLVQAIGELHPRTVEILILRYEHDYSDAEIAKLLGTSRGVIAVTLYRARTRLKKLLRDSSGEIYEPER